MRQGIYQSQRLLSSLRCATKRRQPSKASPLCRSNFEVFTVESERERKSKSNDDQPFSHLCSFFISAYQRRMLRATQRRRCCCFCQLTAPTLPPDLWQRSLSPGMPCDPTLLQCHAQYTPWDLGMTERRAAAQQKATQRRSCCCCLLPKRNSRRSCWKRRRREVRPAAEASDESAGRG